jgi:hypothetical protein
MSDPMTGGGEPTSASSPGSDPAESMSRITAVRLSLVVVSGVALGVVLGLGFGTVSGWDWALVGAAVLVAAWLVSYSFKPTPRSVRITARAQPLAAKAGMGAVAVWLMVFLASCYLLAMIAPFSPGLRTWEIGRPVVVHILIIIFLITVTFHLLFPLIETKRRATLVGRFTRSKIVAKSLFALMFGLIVSTSIALWDQLLLLVAQNDSPAVFTLATSTAGSALRGEPASVTHLINHNDILLLLLWQLGDMVPTLNVNDTIGFEQPLYYTSAVAGWLILGFKVVVGFAVIGIVVAVIQAQRAIPAETGDVSLLPRATQRLLMWRPRNLRQRSAMPPG